MNTDVETIENNPKDRYTEINDIYTKLYNEYKSNVNFYTGEKANAINKILTYFYFFVKHFGIIFQNNCA